MKVGLGGSAQTARSHRGFAAALFALAAMVACGDETGAGATGPPVSFGTADAMGVLQTFGGADAVFRVRGLVDQQIRACMVEQGFEYHLARPDVRGRERARRERNLLFGLPKDARKTGTFGLASTEREYRKELAGSNSFLEKRSDAYRTAWSDALDGTGGPTRALGQRGEIVVGINGCSAKALTAVYGDLDDAYRIQFLPAKIRAEAVAKTLARKEVAAALRRWTECADAEGFKFANPGEGYRFVESHANDAELTSLDRVEKEEAKVYDLFRTCEQKSSLYETASAAISEDVRQTLEAHQGDVELLNTVIAKAAGDRP